MRTRKNLILLFCALAVFSACNQGHKAGSFAAQYTRQPLKEFSDPITEIPSGDVIELLAYSGGSEAKKGDGANYCQFIGVDKTTGDTVRVLATVISVENGDDDGKPVLTDATMYDFDKGIRDATFRVPTDNDKLMIAMLPAEHAGGKPDLPKINERLQDIKVKGYVLIPQGQPFFSRHYKTVVGILSFKDQPW